MVKTRVGTLVRINNQDKKKSANSEYNAVILKKNGQFNQYMFTDVELNVALSRARKNSEDAIDRSLASKILD